MQERDLKVLRVLAALAAEAVRRSRIMYERRTGALEALEWVWSVSRIPKVVTSSWHWFDWYSPDVDQRDASVAVGWTIETFDALTTGERRAAGMAGGYALDAVGRVFVRTGTPHVSVQLFKDWALEEDSHA